MKFHSLLNKIHDSVRKFFIRLFSRDVSRRKALINMFFILIAAGALLVVLLVFLVYAGAFGKLPSKNDLESISNPLASEVYSADSVLMGRYYIQNRLDLNEGEMTPVIVNALLDTEDVRFFKHRGIDIRSLFRVLVKTIILRHESSGGGSTITQQLAKNIYPRKNHGFLSMPVNKLKEMIIASRLEHIYSKEEILELYLNTVPFGEDTYGIKTAAKLYFDKSPRDLNVEEAAMLVGMLKATGYYNPRKYPERARQRRNVVLSQLEHYNYLSARTADSLEVLPVKLHYSALPYYAGIAPYFREFLRLKLEDWCENHRKADGESYNLYTDGLKIYTTIDSRLQKYADESVRENMENLQKIFDREWKNHDLWKSLGRNEAEYIQARGNHNIPEDTVSRPVTVFAYRGDKEMRMSREDSVRYYMHFLQAGFLAMDVADSEIRAWVGGIDFRYFRYDHVLSRRQPGSAFKPLVYLAALQDGIRPCDFYANDSITYEDYDNWNPANADNKYGGSYSVKGALTHSVNTVTSALIMETGTKPVIDLARKAGITSDLPDVPSLALGSASVSLYDLVQVYCSFANGGIARKPVYITSMVDSRGKLLYRQSVNNAPVRICTEKEAQILTAMLENVVNEGTATAIRSKYRLQGEIAGKTGTSQNQSDGWFMGYTPDIVAGAWVGGELPGIRFRNLRYGQGSATALPIFAGFMGKMYDDRAFRNMQYASFNIGYNVERMLDCDDYHEQPTFKEQILRELKKWRIFRRKRK